MSSCETPAITLGIFATDCVEVPKHSAIPHRRLHIDSEVQKHVSGIAEILLISPRKHDIGLYLRLRLNRGSELDAMGEGLEADIQRIIPGVVSGRYVFFLC